MQGLVHKSRSCVHDLVWPVPDPREYYRSRDAEECGFQLVAREDVVVRSTHLRCNSLQYVQVDASEAHCKYLESVLLIAASDVYRKRSPWRGSQGCPSLKNTTVGLYISKYTRESTSVAARSPQHGSFLHRDTQDEHWSSSLCSALHKQSASSCQR